MSSPPCVVVQILTDPKQKRFFTRRDMKDLFSLDEGKGGESETARVFRDVAHEVYSADQHHNSTTATSAQSSGTDTTEAKEGKDDTEDVASAGSRRRKRLKKEPTEAVGGGLAFDVEPFKEEPPASTSTSTPPPSSSSSTGTDRILSLLFSKGGITSAMSHDSIMEGSSRAEKTIAETVAKKVAERAVEALKKSREEMRSQPLNVPTWTGRNGGYSHSGGGGGSGGGEKKRFGAVTRPGMEAKKSREGRGGERMRSYDDPHSSSSSTPSRLFDHKVSGFNAAADIPSSSAPSSSALSSSAVLARLKQRNEEGVVAVSSGVAAAQSMSSIEEREARQALSSPAMAGLLEALVDYLEGRPEGVATQQLIDAFSARLRSDQDKFVFRQLLREVAVLGRSHRGGESRWTLKGRL